ncbi:ABC transporter permease [Snodgrassella alvi]|uniref:ABC transporter permease n=1 Tax=Snodgrassella alvi TaxID=1196083 RepID=UPI0009FD79E0|nr:iron ABC transporter permease [Snodgrassella alvi]ORF02596.1 ABC transporter permease [Snodgrassella alvi]ORF08239.1 ABC transporter permease [Snodgrassella alvi]ORF13798.1 ABC transporter permease [Snodgrassella alvi]ORF14535.1 ABC transporter permease [Snodgrassella alvi]ORF20878.1 ABC transporter permease [Snodgrassella alvi]
MKVVSFGQKLLLGLFSLLPLFFLLAVVLLPLRAMLQQTDADSFRMVWQDEYMRRLLGWTVSQAAISSVLTLLLGVPVAWAVTRLQFSGRNWVLRLLMLPFVIPTLVAGVGILALFGAQGLLWRGWEGTPWLLLYGNVFFNLPVMVRAGYQGLCQVPATRMYAAQTLGAGTWQRFVRIEIPQMLPWLAGGMCLVFLYCFSGFGLALLLGGEHYITLEVQIYQLIAYELDMAQAGVLVLWVLATTFLSGIIYAVLSRYSAQKAVIQMLPPQLPTTGQKAGLVMALLLLLGCCALPLLAVCWRALLAGSSWLVLLESTTWQAVLNTLSFTLMAIMLALLLGFLHAALAKRLMWVRSLTFLPFMVSPVCVSFGLLLCYPGWTASLSMLICTYALLAYPFITKDVLAAWDSLPDSYTQAARTLGAGRMQVLLYVIVPLLRPALQRGLALAAATCIGEFAATLFLSRPEWQTLTTLIYHYLSTAGRDNYDRAMVLTLLLMMLTILIFALVEWSKDKKETHLC